MVEAIAGFVTGIGVGIAVGATLAPAAVRRCAGLRLHAQPCAPAGSDGPNRAAAGTAGLGSIAVGGAVPFVFEGGEIDGRSFERHIAWTERQGLGDAVGDAVREYRPTTREREARRQRFYGH